jgi:hypothetical protein
MLIYLDTYELIDLCDGNACIDIPDLAKLLLPGDHRLLFSLETLIEFSDGLKDGRLLEVRRDLNRIEELPHAFVNEGRIYDSEIREAVSAFAEGREYNFSAVTPFASRLDDAIDLYGRPQEIMVRGIPVPTTMIVNLRLFETIQCLWNSDPHIFDVQRRRELEWIRMLKEDREMAKPPELQDHFVTMIARALEKHRIRSTDADAEPFARWVYESSARCPGVRLTYETYHRFRRDKNTHAEASDIIDLARIPSVPYVDFFVTDKKMIGYCSRAVKDVDKHTRHCSEI